MFSFLLKQLPSGFWAGAVCGAVIVAVFGGFAAYVLSLMLRHWKGLLLLCAVIGAVSLAVIAL